MTSAPVLVPVEVRGLLQDPATRSPILILRERGGERFLPIWIGLFEECNRDHEYGLNLRRIGNTLPGVRDIEPANMTINRHVSIRNQYAEVMHRHYSFPINTDLFRGFPYRRVK